MDRSSDTLDFEFVDEPTGTRGFIVVTTTNRGLSFGGCRFAPTVTKEEVQELSQCMTWKLLPHGLPVGGAKGGLAVDPTKPDCLGVVGRFGKAASQYLSTRVVLGKDLGARDDIIEAMYRGAGVFQLQLLGLESSVTPKRIAELPGYVKNMTGRGVAWATRSWLKGNIAKKRVLIQGFGAVGVGAAVRLSSMGATIIGVSDKEVAVYNQDGIPCQALVDAAERGSIDATANGLDYPHKVMDSNELLGHEADVLILAAGSSCVGEDLANRIASQVVVEGSNFGLVPVARKKLYERQIMVIPDLLANGSSAAMVTTQLAHYGNLKPERMWKNIELNIDRTVTRCVEVANAENLEIRDAYINIVVPELFEHIEWVEE